MVKTRIRHLTRWLVAAIVLSVVVIALVTMMTRQAIRELHQMTDIAALVADIEVNLDEITAATRHYLIWANPAARVKVAESHQDLQRAFSRLASLTEHAPGPVPSSGLAALESQSTRLYQLANTLIDIADRKHALLSRIRAQRQQFWALYDTGSANSSLFSTRRAVQLAGEIKMELSKLIDGLGFALRSPNSDVMHRLHTRLAYLHRLLEGLAAFTLNSAELEWLDTVVSTTAELQHLLAKIGAWQAQALDRLAAFNRLVMHLDTLIDNQVQTFVEARKRRQILKLELTTSTLLALTLLLALLIGFALRRLTTMTRLVDRGVGELLGLTDKLARGEPLDAAMLPDTEGEFHQIGTALVDMRKTLDETLLSRQRVAHLLNQIGTLCFFLHPDNMISHCSEGLCRLLGVPDAPTAASMLREQIDFSRYRQLIYHGVVTDLTWQLVDVHGCRHRIRCAGVVLGEKNGLLLIGHLQANPAPAADDEVLPPTFEGLVLVRGDGVIEAVNSSAERLLGLPDFSAHKQTLTRLCQQQHCSRALAMGDLAALANTGDTVELTVSVDGSPSERYVQLHLHPLEAEAPGGITYAVTLHDITRIRRSETQAYQLASYDSLTGLPNRALLIEQLDRAINAVRQRGGQFAVLLFDLNGFRDINDLLGHDAGDRLLQEMRKRIQEQLDDSDFAARLGGDEFGILTEKLNQIEDAGHFAARVLGALSQAYRLGSHTITPHGNIGIGVYPGDGATAEALLQAAGTALYEAKERGRQRFVFHSNEMTRRVRQRVTLEAELRQAIEAQQFELRYQPQIDLRTGRMVAVEALLRWQHPQRGLLAPDKFLSAAERLGLIGIIGHWVIATACGQWAAWQRAGVEGLRMSVNIAPSHFQQFGFIREVTTIVQQRALEPQQLEIEITEHTARNTEAHIATCTALQKLGVRIAIDDFGVGYSSLSVLKRLHVHTLKVDRLFVRDAVDDSKTTLMLDGIITMGKGLALDTVIEGVETQKQLELVRGLGCRLVQGYYFSKPLLADEIPALASADFFARSHSL